MKQRGVGRSHRAPNLHAGSGMQLARSSLAPRLRARALTVVASAGSVPLTVEVAKKVEFGERIKVVGNDGCLGAWDLGKGVDLVWHEGDIWSTTIDIPVGQQLKFKLVKVSDNGGPHWEDGSDRELTALGPDFGLQASCAWNNTASTEVKAVELATAGVGGGSGSGSSLPEGPTAKESHKSHGHSSSNGSNNGSSNGKHNGSVSFAERSHLDEQAANGTAWVGAQPEFVRSKTNPNRVGQWKTDGLTGIALDMVKGDEKSANWLAKLDLIKALLVDRTPKMRPGLEEMAFCYVYASWISTGAIMCVEGGGHHRPNHHANLALQMFRSLEWVIGDNSKMYSPEGAPSDSLSIIAARRMHTRLPSINGEFRQSVPLTRIRDIAHRNDIPKDLKDEIKHTLQNKLHRNAGPEDLIAAEAMLKRITANPGEYNDDFVGQFKIFMRELREFFNASGLEELLQKTQESLDEAHNNAVNQLLSSKQKVESAGQNASMEDLMSLLFSATQARTMYAAGLSAGLRNDVKDDALEMRQRWRLSEIRLEEYCFVVLSRIVNILEEQGGAASLSKASNNVWALPLSALTSGLRNLGLSQFKAKELLDLENELQAWHNMAPMVQSGKDNALRAKASVDRVVRLAAEYSDSLMRVYAQPAQDLGRGLGVQEWMANVFAESEVRSSVAFQVSKLASLMSKALRMAAGQSAWDALVTGEAYGILTEVSSLNPAAVESLASKGKSDGLVLAVRGATGDEELGPLVPWGLRGVVLRQELPHLSHLGVRARQEKVTFATIDEDELYAREVKPLLGKQVKLQVSPTGEVTLKEATRAELQAHKTGKPAVTAEVASTSAGWSGVQRVSNPTLVPLAQAYAELCGSKAAKCADLERLAIGVEKLFRTPIGCCLPFGSMELAVKAAGAEAEFKSLLDELEKASSGEALDKACGKMQKLVSALSLPGDLLKQITDVFAGNNNTLLAVRSSANVEDLAGMSAAGLYESVVGVPASDSKAVAKAVGAVWASLYTRRAVMTRKAARVPQNAATMCVLIQELFCPKVSFVLHTARPSDGNEDFILAEAAPGQGETLAAATAGTPWRWEVDKTSGTIKMLAFANFSRALLVNPTKPSAGLAEVEVDYSKQRLSVDAGYRTQVARRLALVGCAIEAYYDKVPQDIEGGLVSGDSNAADVEIFVFQTRPQQ